MPVWVLMFQLAGGAEFLGGEYQSEHVCLIRAEQQIATHWRRIYGDKISYT